MTMNQIKEALQNLLAENNGKETQKAIQKYLRELVKQGVLQKAMAEDVGGEYITYYQLLPNEVDPGERRSYGGVMTSTFLGKYEVLVEDEFGTQIPLKPILKVK